MSSNTVYGLASVIGNQDSVTDAQRSISNNDNRAQNIVLHLMLDQAIVTHLMVLFNSKIRDLRWFMPFSAG